MLWQGKKDCHPFSIRMDKEAYEKLLAMCEDSGMSKTIAIERAVIQFADGLMSIFWTQKVKLFYAALLANNSH